MDFCNDAEKREEDEPSSVSTSCVRRKPLLRTRSIFVASRHGWHPARQYLRFGPLSNRLAVLVFQVSNGWIRATSEFSESHRELGSDEKKGEFHLLPVSPTPASGNARTPAPKDRRPAMVPKRYTSKGRTLLRPYKFLYFGTANTLHSSLRLHTEVTDNLSDFFQWGTGNFSYKNCWSTPSKNGYHRSQPQERASA